MKLFSILILTILFIQICTNENENVHKRGKPKKPNNKTKTKVKNNKSNAKVKKEKPPILNSVGRQVFVSKKSDIILTKFPFEVTRCDQVVAFKAQFISNLKEFRARQNGSFTLTAHFANLFATNNHQKLLKSILLAEIRQEPKKLVGSGGCIIIASKDGPEQSITICTDNKKKQENILDVLKAFRECGGGKNKKLRKLDKIKIAQMIKKCGGKSTNPQKLLKKLKKEKARAVRKNKKFFHPGSDDVPGIPLPQENDEKTTDAVKQ